MNLAPSADASLLGPVERLAQFLAAETQALRSLNNCDLDANNRIKSEALLDLTRRLRSVGGAPAGPALRAALDGLRGALAENQAALQVHLDAARAVSAIIVRALEHDQSDRTYSGDWRRGERW